jgi:hypothetical protein
MAEREVLATVGPNAVNNGGIARRFEAEHDDMVNMQLQEKEGQEKSKSMTYLSSCFRGALRQEMTVVS